MQIAGLAAFQAVVQAVGAETNVIAPLAHEAVAIASAALFFQLADHALEFFRHQANVARLRPSGKWSFAAR
jgi:hypothetical protein